MRPRGNRPELVATSGRSRVLLVEDDAASREALLALLESRYDVRTTEGSRAIDTARASAPDLVLAELHLSRQNGLAMLNALSRDARTEQIPIVFLSAPDEDLMVRCFEAGAADFIAKPASGKEIIARIDRGLRAARERKVLQALAQTDGLTGLANYRALVKRIEHEFQRAARYGHPLSVVTIDLDHLKDINDRYGHDVGNRAIAALARHLSQSLREADFAARFGGDEFVVLLPHQTPREALVFADRLRRGLGSLEAGERADERSRCPELSVSIGIAGHSTKSHKSGAEELLHASDAALYEAKRRGRNQVVIYEDELEARGRAEYHA